jgi:hypothetical protein
MGIVKKVEIKCKKSNKEVNVDFLGLKKFDDVLKKLKEDKRGLGEIM